MSRRPYRPLWADPPPEPPRPEVVVHRLEIDEHEDAPRRPERSPRWRGAAVVALAVAAVAAVLAWHGDGLRVETLPSAWEEIPMRCETLRLERDGGAVEAFSCRAVRGGGLPPGVYRSPDAQWTSDFTRRDARESAITISREGELRGWAIYRPE